MRKILILLVSAVMITVACKSAPEPKEEAVEEQVQAAEQEVVSEPVETETAELEIQEPEVSEQEVEKNKNEETSRIVFFAPKAVEIDAFIAGNLDFIAEEIKELGVKHVTVTGYSARLDSTEEERRISQKRAAAVAEYLMNTGSFSDEGVTIKAMGAEEPLMSHQDIAGRSKNRRVEIIYE